jgi:lysyl-tRNA synthetase class 2
MMWRPTCDLAAIVARAELLRTIREFFYARQVLEVETPLLATTAITDPFLVPVKAALSHLHSSNGNSNGNSNGSATHTSNLSSSLSANSWYYLQTSPEFAMKRILAAYQNQSIYQICKAFRDEESSRQHNLEFTMLEWYRVGFTDSDLMVEVDVLLQQTLACAPAQKLSYAEVFWQYLKINPHTATLAELHAIAKQQQIDVVNQSTLSADDLLNLLFSYVIQPNLTGAAPFIIYNYPKSQAALAKLRIVSTERTLANDVANDDTHDNNATHDMVAARFEVFYRGIELGNGYYELQDSNEQQRRFLQDNQLRQQLNLPIMPIDTKLIAALEAGLPECAGIAIGVDRLLMAKLGSDSLQQVMAFPVSII